MQKSITIIENDTAGELWGQIQHLRSFLDVIHADSLAAAARAMNRATSAVGRSVTQLEQALGVELLARTPSGIFPTDAGRIVEARAHRISDEIHAAAKLYTEGEGRNRPTASNAAYILFNGRKLEILLALATTGAVWRTAAQLGVSQSAISMALSRIEEILGETLFVRSKHGLLPSRKMQSVLRHVRRVASELRHVRAELDSLSHGVAGSVVVGMLSMARTQLFPAAAADILTQYPAVQIKALEWSFDHLVEGLRNGDVDFTIGVTRDADEHAGLMVEHISSDMLTIVARPQHPLFARGTLTLRDLILEHWILPRPNSRGGRLILESFDREGVVPPQPSLETADLQVIRKLLLSSDMLAIASAQQLSFELQSGQLREVPIRLCAGRRDIALIWREGAHLSPAAYRLMGAIRVRAKEMTVPIISD